MNVEEEPHSLMDTVLKEPTEMEPNCQTDTKTEHPKYRTGFVYDAIMAKHKDPRNENHVENPTRITHIYEALQDNGLLKKTIEIPARAASVAEISCVHSKEYIETVRQYKSSDEFKCDIPETYPTFVCDDTYEAAATAVGACLSLVDSILSNQVQNGFALVRPPGHHARTAKSDGFCFFNNVAIVARYIQKNFSNEVKKILIFDWDVHHGNGTQGEFYNDDVLYISIHRHDDGRFYPGFSGGDAGSCGSGEGRGRNVNIPWSCDEMGDEEYLTAFNVVVLPILEYFEPDILLISAGYDAAEGDPLGEYHVTPEVFGHMTRCLMNSTNGRVMLILEGGYNNQSVTSCVSSCIQALIGQETTSTNQWCDVNYQNLKNESARGTIEEVAAKQNEFFPIQI